MSLLLVLLVFNPMLSLISLVDTLIMLMLCYFFREDEEDEALTAMGPSMGMLQDNDADSNQVQTSLAHQ